MNKIKLLGGPQDGAIIQFGEKFNLKMPNDIYFDSCPDDNKSIYVNSGKKTKACYEFTETQIPTDTFEMISVYKFSKYVKFFKDE